ncbi:MAG: hypothetical protein JWM40_1782 [Frankiales bacterium]|nr:hypothetical protein [Frankiales bacterium]
MTRWPRAAAIAAVAVLAVVTSGCGKQVLGGTAGADIKALPASTLPREISGLTVKQESITKPLKQTKHSYADAIGFYSLRQDKVVQATVQVSQLGPEARLEDEGFRQQLVDQSSPGTAVPLTIGESTVMQSTGTKATVSIWFSQERMVLLTVLSTYDGARGLLEQTLAALPAT